MNPREGFDPCRNQWERGPDHVLLVTRWVWIAECPSHAELEDPRAQPQKIRLVRLHAHPASTATAGQARWLNKPQQWQTYVVPRSDTAHDS